MISGGQSAVWPANLAAGILETLESLLFPESDAYRVHLPSPRKGVTHGRCHLVHEMAVNVQQDGAIELLVDDVVLEDLVVKGLGGAFGDRHLGRVVCV